MWLRAGPYCAAAFFAFGAFNLVNDIRTSDGEELDGKCIEIVGDRLVEAKCSATHDGKIVAALPLDSDDFCPLA